MLAYGQNLSRHFHGLLLKWRNNWLIVSYVHNFMSFHVLIDDHRHLELLIIIQRYFNLAVHHFSSPLNIHAAFQSGQT